MYETANRFMMPDKDMAYTLLTGLKRVAREYATAVTEASCPEIRQMFTNLLSSTLRLQGDLYYAMQQHNMYTYPSPALKQEIDKQLRHNKQTLQTTKEFILGVHASGQPKPHFAHPIIPSYVHQSAMQYPTSPSTK